LGKAQLIVTVFLVFKRHNEKAKQNEGDKGVEAKKGRKVNIFNYYYDTLLFLLQKSTAATEAKSDISLFGGCGYQHQRGGRRSFSCGAKSG
jgi:hypothetical protein